MRSDSEKCQRCQSEAYCSRACLIQDFSTHALQCPLSPTPEQVQGKRPEPQTTQAEWNAVPILPQPAGLTNITGALIDTEAVCHRLTPISPCSCTRE